MEAALFQDLGNSSAIFDAPRWAFIVVAHLETTCRWLTPCRLITPRTNSQEYHAGWNYLMKRGIHLPTSTNSVDL